MTLSTFLSHQWLNFWRSRNANRSLAIQIVVGFFYLLIFLEIAGLGIFLPVIIRESLPGQDPIMVFTSYIIYYFLIGLLMRFQMQELPSLSIQPYLTQNIKRKLMLRFLNVRSLVHIINFMPLFVFIPFTLAEIVPVYGNMGAICFLVALFSLVINNHFLNMFIKRKTGHNSWWLLIILVIILLLRGIEYLHIVSLSKMSTHVFTFLLKYPMLCMLSVAIAYCSFLINNRYLRNHLYIEELVSERKLKLSKNYAFLGKFGNTGDMIALELKLIFRNKRPRSMVILSAVFLLYGFILYRQYAATSDTLLFLFALLITGVFISNYGQFLFAWQSSHFDGMMTYNTNIKQYIKAKFFLLVSVCTVQFLLASLYGFINWRIVPIQLAAFLYSVGVNSFLTIYAATYHYKYLDLSTRSSAMNFQGLGAVQWLQSLAISFGPVLIFSLLNAFFGFRFSIIIISGIGLAGLLLHEQIIAWLATQFNLRKHKILEGFREK
jgi:hypothetical protein